MNARATLSGSDRGSHVSIFEGGMIVTVNVRYNVVSALDDTGYRPWHVANMLWVGDML